MTEDEDFVSAVAEVFGPRHETFSDGLRGSLREFWRMAVETERRHTFRYLRGFVDQADDKEFLMQISWILANGTYRTRPSLSALPPWLEDEEERRARIADRLMVRRLDAHRYGVTVRGTDEHVATMTFDEGQWEVWHAPEDRAQATDIRRFPSWNDALADVAARRAVLERAPRAPSGPDDV